MTSWPAVLITSDLGDLADDVRRLFHELERQPDLPHQAAAGQCTPPLDVFETDETLEVVIDLPGVPVAAIRVLLKANVVVIAGEKASLPPDAAGTGDYHLLERGFGRFARAVRLGTAFDGSRARATLVGGELRVELPKIHERRGVARVLPIATTPGRG